MITGKGVYSFSGGDVYEGDLIAGVKEGTGKYTYANGDVYEGGFSGDLRHGEGKMTWADGSVYEGGFVFGLKCGKGSYLYSNGDKYVGDFEDDMRQGEGTYTDVYKRQGYVLSAFRARRRRRLPQDGSIFARRRTTAEAESRAACRCRA